MTKSKAELKTNRLNGKGFEWSTFDTKTAPGMLATTKSAPNAFQSGHAMWNRLCDRISNQKNHGSSAQTTSGTKRCQVTTNGLLVRCLT